MLAYHAVLMHGGWFGFMVIHKFDVVQRPIETDHLPAHASRALFQARQLANYLKPTKLAWYFLIFQDSKVTIVSRPH